jgi:hypothetical protein
MSEAGKGAGLDGVAIEMRRQGGEVYGWCPALGLHASAPTADGVLVALEARLGELRAFEARSGLSLSTRFGALGASRGEAARGWLRRIGVPVLIGGLVAMQLGWAISVGLSTGLGRAFNAQWRESLVVALERQVLALAEPKAELGAAEQARLVAAVRALKSRYRPVWDEIVGQDPAAGPR